MHGIKDRQRTNVRALAGTGSPLISSGSLTAVALEFCH